MVSVHANTCTRYPYCKISPLIKNPRLHPEIIKISAYGTSTHPNENILKAKSRLERINSQTNVTSSFAVASTIVAMLNSQMVSGEENMLSRFLSHASCKNNNPISSCDRATSVHIRSPPKNNCTKNTVVPVSFWR